MCVTSVCISSKPLYDLLRIIPFVELSTESNIERKKGDFGRHWNLPVERKKYEKTKTHILLLLIETTGVSFLLGKFNQRSADFDGVYIFFWDTYCIYRLQKFVRYWRGCFTRFGKENDLISFPTSPVNKRSRNKVKLQIGLIFSKKRN